jgi:serine/threonine protein kinase
MAEVLLARRTLLEGPAELVVLKRVLPHLSQNESFLRMFATEARLASQLRHPNIVSVIDVGEMDHLPFIAMERLDGADLLRLLQQCALTSADARHRGGPSPWCRSPRGASGTPTGPAGATAGRSRIIHRDVSRPQHLRHPRRRR